MLVRPAPFAFLPMLFSWTDMDAPPRPLSQAIAGNVPRNIPRNVYVFGLTSFLNDTASEMAYWILPAFLASLGAGPAQLGIIEGIAESVASFAKFFSGYLADKVAHRKPIVVGGYFVANAVKPLLALVSSWWQILAIRFFDRFSKGVRGTARDVMVAESVDKSMLGSAYGLIQGMDSAGAIAGPLLALGIIGRFGMRAVFASAAIPGALCVIVVWLGIREVHRGGNPLTETGTNPELLGRQAAAPARTGGDARPSTSESKWLPKLPAGFYYVLAVVTLFSLGNSSDMFLVLRAGNIGIPASRAPLLGLVFNIMFTLLSWPAGKFSDRFSRSAIAAAGYFVFAMVYFVFALAPSQLAIWLTMAFYGLFYALTNPVLKALVVESVGADVRGRALGIYSFLTSVTTLLSSVITGALWKVYGPAVPFYFSAGIATVSAFALLAHRSPARPVKT
ncbi:MAG: MFS transporter [Terriglobales bacterium]|jgi:MFS family permease